jgi:hypothetical protein
LKIKVNYDFTQQELVGDSDVIEVADVEFVYWFCGG